MTQLHCCEQELWEERVGQPGNSLHPIFHAQNLLVFRIFVLVFMVLAKKQWDRDRILYKLKMTDWPELPSTSTPVAMVTALTRIRTICIAATFKNGFFNPVELLCMKYQSVERRLSELTQKVPSTQKAKGIPDTQRMLSRGPKCHWSLLEYWNHR